MTNPKILICGNYGATNIGDDTILEGIIQDLEEITPRKNITVLTKNPEETKESHNINTRHFIPCGVRSFLNFFTKKTHRATIKSFKESDLIILGGGGLFVDRRLHAPLIWGIHALVATLYKKPLFCYAQSVGPLETKTGKAITKLVFKQAKAITVRDQKSEETLKALGIKGKITISADPAFNLVTPQEQERKRQCALSLREWDITNENFKESINFLVNYLIEEKKSTVHFIPFQRNKPNDITFLKSILTKENFRKITISKATTPQETLKELSQNTLLIGMRLHSCILSTITHTPFIALSYSQKVSSFLEGIDQKEQMIKLNEISKESLKEKIDSTLNSLSQKEKELKQAQESQHAKALLNRQILKEVLHTLKK